MPDRIKFIQVSNIIQDAATHPADPQLLALTVPLLRMLRAEYFAAVLAPKNLVSRGPVRRFYLGPADPIAYRRKLLKADAKKSRAVLDLLEAESAWRNSLGHGHAPDLRVTSRLVRVSLARRRSPIQNNRPKIHRVTVAVDCGTGVNPLTVESQFQPGSASAVQQLMTKGAITFKEDTCSKIT